MTKQPPADTPPEVTGFGSVQDWAPFIGAEEATLLLSGLGALGGSQELLDEITAAVMPGGPAAGAPAASTEEQLRRAELRFRSLVENLPCVAFVASMGQARSEVYVNRYIEQLLGYTREEWLRDPFLWYWRVHPDDRAAWNEEFARGLATGGPWQADCRFLAADGHAVWVRGHAQIVRDEVGRPLFLQGIAIDIGSIKQAEEAARTGRDRALAALDALPDVLAALAADDSLIHVNAEALALLGGTAGTPATLGELAQRFAPAGPALIECVERCRRTGAPEAIEADLPGPPRRRLRIECLSHGAAARAGGIVVLRFSAGPR